MKDLERYITQLLSPEMKRVVTGAFYNRFGFCPSEIDELIQATAVKQYEYFLKNELTDRHWSNIKTYFATSVQNMYIDQGRLVANRDTYHYEALEIDLDKLNTLSDTPEEEYDEEYLLAKKVFQKLPEHLQEVIELLVQGHSYKQIAAKLNINLQTVKNWIFRAREESKIIRKKLQKR